MKILYVASNPDTATNLNLSKEITELQRQALKLLAEPVSIVFLPHVKFEDLPAILHREEPDILHLATHGDGQHLMFANEAGQPVRVDAEMLSTFLSEKRPPRLVYVNACDSNAISQELLRTVSMAIGSTAPITNRSARAAAIAFYERILDGAALGRAFAVCQKIMEGSSDRNANVKLHIRSGIDPNNEIFCVVPRLVAEFTTESPRPDRDGNYKIRFGLAGCPKNTRQLIFFTDDDEFIDADDLDSGLEEDLCLVVRPNSKGGQIWTAKEEAWFIGADFRLFLTGVTGDGRQYSTSSMICDALEARYGGAGEIRPEIVDSIAKLRSGVR